MKNWKCNATGLQVMPINSGVALEDKNKGKAFKCHCMLLRGFMKGGPRPQPHEKKTKKGALVVEKCVPFSFSVDG